MTVKDRPGCSHRLDHLHLLALLPGMKPEYWQRVLDQLDDPAQLLTLTPPSLKALGLPARARQVISGWQGGRMEPELQQRLEHVRASCQSHHIEVVDWCHPDYPESLRHIHGPPPVLYLRGDVGALRHPCLAMVGSRHASRDGLNHANGFARALADQGITVVSGLALGIDGAAHRGALEAGGVTLGVLANGVDTPYPRQHSALATDILKNNGALISELPPGTPARPHLFPQRNRIISGLCRGVLVVEASVRSGSLITARLAMEQGRDVFAIPGSIHNPGVRGCHRLIRAGAMLVETVQDIVTELADWGFEGVAAPDATLPGPDPQALDALSRQLLDVLTYEPRSSDQLCQDTGLAAAELLQTMLTLEMEGFAEATPGGYRKRAG